MIIKPAPQAGGAMRFMVINTPHRAGLHSCDTNAFLYAAAQTQSRRFASANKKQAVPSKSQSLDPKLANAPLSTIPAPIATPARKAFDSSFKYYLALGKAYVGFYKTGMKNVFNNYKAAKRIRKEIGLENTWPFLPPAYPTTDVIKGTGKPGDQEKVARLSRADFQLLCRSAYDFRRLIPFSVMLIVCGELTPFVVMALGSLVVPKTCQIPRQIDADELAFARRKRHVAEFELPAKWSDLKTLPKPFNVDKLDVKAVMAAALGLNLAKRLPRESQYPLLTKWVYRPRLRKQAAYLAWDDELIRRYGGVDALSSEEVKRAVLERGGVHVIVLGNENRDREWLKNWLQGRR